MPRKAHRPYPRRLRFYRCARREMADLQPTHARRRQPRRGPRLGSESDLAAKPNTLATGRARLVDQGLRHRGANLPTAVRTNKRPPRNPQEHRQRRPKDLRRRGRLQRPQCAAASLLHAVVTLSRLCQSLSQIAESWIFADACACCGHETRQQSCDTFKLSLSSGRQGK